MEAIIVEKSNYIESLEINLATLMLRVNMMENQLYHCRDREVPQEVPEDDAGLELSYIMQEYYTPPVTMTRIIKVLKPLVTALVGPAPAVDNPRDTIL